MSTSDRDFDSELEDADEEDLIEEAGQDPDKTTDDDSGLKTQDDDELPQGFSSTEEF